MSRRYGRGRFVRRVAVGSALAGLACVLSGVGVAQIPPDAASGPGSLDLGTAAPATPNPADAGNQAAGSLPPATTAAPPPATVTVEPPAKIAGSAEPIVIDHPRVLDSARLENAGQPLPLFGITGAPGPYAEGLHGFIAAAGDRVACEAQAGGEYICLLPDGTDVAMVALANGAAQVRADAPEAYRAQEAAAQEARRGLWNSLPGAPTEVKGPSVRDTATLIAGDKTYRLDGIDGLGGKYARDLHDYIAANGNALRCHAAGQSDRYVCLTPDGTDIAKVALVNGAARVSAGAPDSYRLQQGEALSNHRGYWEHPPADVVVAARQTMPAPAPVMAPGGVAAPGVGAYPMVAGDEGEGVAYIGGQPTAVIGGETVFLVFAGTAGWGYWDHYHRWHGAPDRYAHHMERFHPGGHGLRGYGYAPRGGHFAGPAVREPHVYPGAHEPHVYPGVHPAGVPRPVTPNPGFVHPNMPARGFAPVAHPVPMARPMAPAFHPAAAPPPRAPAHACPPGRRC